VRHRPHGRETSRTGPAQKTEKEGLGLIVAMLGQQDGVGRLRRKGMATGIAGSGLKALVSRDNGHPFKRQGNAPGSAQRRAMACPCIGAWLQPMMNMEGGEFEAQLSPQRHQTMQQNSGIESTGEGRTKAPRRLRRTPVMLRAQERGDAIRRPGPAHQARRVSLNLP
jgi:hypothetical protein